MEPRELYEVHRATVLDIIGDDLGAWETLTHRARSEWGEHAYVQTLRDRPISVILRETQEGVPSGTRPDGE